MVDASSSAAASATDPKETGAVQKSSATANDHKCDWTRSTISKREEKNMRCMGLISDDEKDIRFPGLESHPNPPPRIHCDLTPNSILYLDIVITVCEGFLSIDPHWGFWKKIFFVKRHSGINGLYIVGGVSFIVRKEVNYFNFLMKGFVQGWRSKWFYLTDRPASGHRSDLPKFSDVLEATPKKSWQKITTKNWGINDGMGLTFEKSVSECLFL
ncbi:hypothetical protein QYE76_018976 [Lolium multiflorum]|uniref:Uncharacterized protein n=1 Tax=Lolium multiflorum TaxID=4521 RepID=A0AAD8V6W8_LOLMU|nr:hypothetical protein QYE76_018976 [Lolium multiflorum]